MRWSIAPPCSFFSLLSLCSFLFSFRFILKQRVWPGLTKLLPVVANFFSCFRFNYAPVRGTTDTIRLWRCRVYGTVHYLRRVVRTAEAWRSRARWHVNTLAAHRSWRRWRHRVYLLQRRPQGVRVFVLFAAVFSLVICDLTLFGRPPTCADLCCSPGHPSCAGGSPVITFVASVLTRWTLQQWPSSHCSTQHVLMRSYQLL